MQLLIIVIIFCLFIFLYRLHLLTEDDFVILRKNLTTESIFNLAFIMFLVGIFSARFFYVIFNPRPVLLEPLGFILFPYFPGLSLMGGIFGTLIFYVLYSKKANLPIGRVFDFIAKSFLAAAPFGVIGIIVLSLKFNLFFAFILIFYFAALALSYMVEKKADKWLSDGSFGLITLSLVSISSIVSSMFQISLNAQLLFFKENPISVLLFIISLLLFIQNERKRIFRTK